MSLAAATTDFSLLRPEAALAAGLCAILAADLLPGSRTRNITPWLGLLACALAFTFSLAAPTGNVGSMLAIDGLTNLARCLILACTAAVLLAGAGERRARTDQGAWSVSVLAIGLGALLTAAAANFVPLWLGLELIGLASYTLVAFRGGHRLAAEAGMKFVLFGGAASGLMLFGISHIFGITGHLDFVGIGAAVATGMPVPVVVALAFASIGIAYKLTLVPFHFYSPDVYQGAPALSVAVVSTVPKIAAVAALVRGLQLAVPTSFVATSAVATALATASAISVLTAAFLAVAQRDAKRILAFSGIGHGAIVLLAIACLPGDDATAAAGYYLLTYAPANLGAWLCLSILERDHASCELTALAGAGSRRPVVTALLCVFLFSLAGVPPLAGFLGKWGVLQQAFAHGLAADGTTALVVAALITVLATAVAAWSYLLIVRAVLLADAPPTNGKPLLAVARPSVVVLAVCTAAVLWLGLWLAGLPAIARAL